MNFELRQLEAFVAVAEELHFGRAASRLHIAQPALSQQILRLEATLGADLLVRQRRRTALSEAGRLFLVEARRTLHQARVAQTVAERAQRGELGRLRIGYTPTASSQHFLRMLGEFQRAVPEVDLSLSELPIGSIAAPLRDDLVDVAFVVTLGQFDCAWLGDDVELRQLSCEAFVAAVPAGHRLADRAGIDVADLADETFAFLARDLCPHWFEMVTGVCRTAGFTPRLVHQAGEVGTQLTLVAAGLGVALVQESARMLRADGIAYLPIRHSVPRVSSGVVWRAGDASPVLGRFRAALPTC
ncbi:LysR family transcriptional regulator [Plantactinospora sp. S1510]|uniref:LysR family transcriptional regulator n=1 Tax=Plantactinospora alkalitolerans TaxID=2789879 RepID=A0ABS0H9W0_9ACTN|nr:LysR family transcriptional regulator [Plantactinospora alkalitolerans]MBF9135104.1 LysR family transcriptional regulator [Plantactinospora alkalitolerans]